MIFQEYIYFHRFLFVIVYMIGLPALILKQPSPLKRKKNLMGKEPNID